MGAYLSEPVTETVSTDETLNGLTVGASSMQGWRVSQEDAHTCILNYDNDTSLFGVFDGHGGAEVALYSAANLPKLLKQIPAYKEERFVDALQEAFLKFDSSLVESEVVKELKALAGSIDDDDDEEDENEASLLREEANIPIEDLIARYKCETPDIKMKGLPSHLKAEMEPKTKPLSPYLRAKQNNNSSSVPETVTCSSSTAKDFESQCEPCCSSSVVSNGELASESKHDECESVSSSAEANSKKPPIENDGGDNNNVSSSKMDDRNEDDKPNEDKVSEATEDTIPSSSSFSKTNSNVNKLEKKEKEEEAEEDEVEEEEGGVSTSSEINRSCSVEAAEDDVKEDCSRPTSSDKSVSDASSVKGKGKQKKIIEHKSVDHENQNVIDSQPVYKAFLEDFDNTSDDSSEESDETDDYKTNLADSDSEVDDDDGDDDDGDEDEEDSSDEGIEDGDEDECKNKSIFKGKRLFLSNVGDYEEPGKDSGCTAVLALLRGNKLFVANAGDSRCVVSCNGKAIDLSVDHKPEDESERQRIEKAGGQVTSDGRVNGGLNLSRAIGDHSYKDNPNISLKEQMITAFPDVKHTTLIPGDHKFMVLACDGIWNSMTSQQVVDYISERIDKTEKLSSICEELFHHCLSSNTMGDGTGCDNMTCVIVRLDRLGKRKREEDVDDDLSVSDENPQSKRRKEECD